MVQEHGLTKPTPTDMAPMGWGALGCRGYPSFQPQAAGLGDLDLSGAAAHAFAAALKVVATTGVITKHPPPPDLAPPLLLRGEEIQGPDSPLGDISKGGKAKQKGWQP